MLRNQISLNFICVFFGVMFVSNFAITPPIFFCFYCRPAQWAASERIGSVGGDNRWGCVVTILVPLGIAIAFIRAGQTEARLKRQNLSGGKFYALVSRTLLPLF